MWVEAPLIRQAPRKLHSHLSPPHPGGHMHCPLLSSQYPAPQSFELVHLATRSPALSLRESGGIWGQRGRRPSMRMHGARRAALAPPLLVFMKDALVRGVESFA
eukprot:CAMPEP_0182850506 /NCGR_PEP_ID=MMETSP0006_2-20121128/30133_1 /TAXON_ID=97485 /ORGANISM="Prymnesium parvum, Strain Texoma1" /LENGTH=103 /DNA_ID=CAMNT_0024981121 /DNA_START=287 /DNA_END=598 /DNA_ORIENTATION=+